VVRPYLSQHPHRRRRLRAYRQEPPPGADHRRRPL